MMDDDVEPLELRTPEYDYTRGTPAWVEVFLFVVMAAGFLVAAFYLGYELGAGNR